MSPLSSSDEALARAAISKFFITEKQLEEATSEVEPENGESALGDVLIKKGYITERQLPVLQKYARSKGLETSYLSRGDLMFGKIVVECGMASAADLENALVRQIQLGEKGEKRRLGEVLVMDGVLTLTQVKNLLEVQKKNMMQCPSCDARYTVTMKTPGLVPKCAACGAELIKAITTSGGSLPRAVKKERVATRFQPDTRMGKITNPLLKFDETKSVPKRFGNFEILEEIARGGMGIVYKARQVGLNRTVALKVLLSDRILRRSSLDQFYKEAEAVAKLKHPNIVLVYDVGEVEGEHYISMEYIHGESLSSILEEGPLEPERAFRVARSIASALAYAHLQGIFHRDVKPGNIMIEKNTGRALLTDFGIAVYRKSEYKSPDKDGYAVGTPPYMSPEQADPKSGKGRPDSQSDLYSLGVVLYEMLAGEPPFRGNNALELVYKVLNEKPRLPRALNPEVPAEAEAVCMKAMAKNKDDRYATWEEFIYDLDAFFDDDVYDPSTDKKSRLVIALLVVTIILLIALSGLIIFLSVA